MKVDLFSTETYESQFLRITRSRYNAMSRRFSERRSKRGRVTRVGFPIPFSLAQYRAWIQTKLGGDIAGLGTCEYCGKKTLTFETLVTEHRVAPSRGGTLALDNLAASCDACNQQKGSISATAFKALRMFLASSPQILEIERLEILGRLQRATRLAVSLRHFHAKAAKQKVAVDDDFDQPLPTRGTARYRVPTQKVRIVPHQHFHEAPNGKL